VANALNLDAIGVEKSRKRAEQSRTLIIDRCDLWPVRRTKNRGRRSPL